MAKYVVVEDDNHSGCLTALLIGIIVIAVVAYFAFYVLAIALGIILIISGVIGTFITIRNYIVALRDCITKYGHSIKPNGWIIPTFLYRWIKISWETTKDAWSYNVGNIKNFFGKIGFYKFLSFKKWIYLFSGLSIIIFGTIVSLSILLLHFYLIFIALNLIVTVLLAVSIIFGLIGLCISVATSTSNYLISLKESFDSSATVFSAYITSCGYSEYLSIAKNYWAKTQTYIRDGFDMFRTLPLFSLKKWVRLWSSIVMIIVGAVVYVFFAIIHIVCLTILFLVFKPISVLK